MKSVTRQLGPELRVRAVGILIAILALLPMQASAAGLAPRSISVGSSGPDVTTSYAVAATTATSAVIVRLAFSFAQMQRVLCDADGVITTGQ